MLAPLRRSLGERILESSVCKVCTRSIHSQNPIRGAAVAQVQINDEFIHIDSKKSKNASSIKQTFKSPPAPFASTPRSKQQKSKSHPSTGKHVSLKAMDSTPVTGKHAKVSKETILATAATMNSPYSWDADSILSRYEEPSEKLLPPKCTIKRKGSKAKVYKWRDNPLKFIEDGLHLRIKFEFISLEKLKVGNGWRVKIAANWNKNGSIAIGDGKTKEIAAENAALHLLLKDYGSPMIQNALIVGTHSAISQDLIYQNRSAKVDVYDYAAQLDTIPTFESIPVPSTAELQAKTGWLVRITVNGTIVSGEGYHHQKRAYAEIAACINFKKRAEELHQGEKMMVKHINTLTSQTGGKFLEYCKIKQRDWEQYNFTFKQHDGFDFTGQLFLGDRLLSECVMYTKSDAEAICNYLAARDMKAQDGKLWKDFVVYIHEHAGEILKPVSPLGVWMNLETIGALRNRLHRLMELDRELEAFSRIQKSLSDEVDAELETLPAHHEPRERLSDAAIKSKSERLLERLNKYETGPEIEEMRSLRATLPLNQYAAQVTELFRNNDVSVLVGATGSGKTTQVPQLLLDEAIREGRGAECNIICTQPRRIAAMSVAKRVATERNENLRQTVGYQVRFGYTPPEWGGSITYCTTGVLLRQLREGWGALKGVTHIIVDEVHERDVQIDFLMVLLRRILDARLRGEDAPPIKVILMSATIDTTLFRRYFGAGFDGGECPYIEIPGRMFPVEKFYLDDVQTMLAQYPGVKQMIDRDPITKKYITKEMEARKDIASFMQMEEEEAEESGIDWARTGSEWEREDADFREDITDQPDLMIANTIAHLCSKKDDGAVLVFLPGLREIVSLDKVMKSQPFLGQDFTDESKFRVFMLHSSIPTMQQDVFLPLADGQRKIILATNIAETSVTIPEVAFVIDTCKHREKRYSQLRRSTALVCTWISQSSAKQRAGRAGRVKAGEYYALVYRERYGALPTGENAEIKRSDLQTVCLDVRSYGIKEPIADVLEECIEPPSSLAVVTALKSLRNLGALDNDENVTPLGSILSQLPVQPSLGKMVLLGAIFKCLDPILILAAIESSRNIFLNPPGMHERSSEIRYSMSLGQPSDHYALLNGFREWRFIKATKGRAAANEFAFENLMHVGGLQTIEKTSEQMLEMLVDWNLVRDIKPSLRYNNELGDPELNINSDVQPLVLALLTAGLMPNLAVQMNPVLLQTSADPKALIHPSSLNSNAGEKKSDKKSRYLGAGPPGTFIMFSSKSSGGGGVFLRDTTIIGPMTGLMFSGKLQQDERSNILTIDDWLPFKFETGVAPQVLQLTKCVDSFLSRTWARLKVLKARNHSKSFGDGTSFYDADPARDPVVKSVVEILERSEHLERLRRKVETQAFNQRRTDQGEFGVLR